MDPSWATRSIPELAHHRPYWEPPVFNYSAFDVNDKVQKERYEPEAPVRDVPWLTSVFDCEMEQELLDLHLEWAISIAI